MPAKTTAVTKVPEGQTYLFPLTDANKGRNFISHGFSTQSLIRKRYTENTSTAAITLNFLLPYLNAFNARLEGHIKDGRDLTAEEGFKHLYECLFIAGINYVDVASRVGIQTALACYCIQHPSAAGNATVYLWDAYPRMHRKYMGDVLAALKLPKFVGSLLGVLPTSVDLEIFDTRTSAMNAFEDSIRRHLFVSISDIIVTNARLIITNFLDKRKLYKTIARQEADEIANSGDNAAIIAEAKTAAASRRREADAQKAVAAPIVAITAQKLIVLAGRAAGAAIGNSFKGGVGEYWIEMLSGVIVAGYSASLLAKTVKKSTNNAVASPSQE